MRNAYDEVSVGKLERKMQLGRLGVNRIILKWVLKTLVGMVWIGFIWIRIAKGGVIL
jgi:hypothetical protein